ncbi:hydroxycinnamoyltransferase-like isoform X1 [Pyrus communis]|uniref:hydroxycinnamoyltransferase-like isoform X2 n=1 Tax=Pyrus communis TaxID=23211 RepID=UPI0035BFFCB2
MAKQEHSSTLRNLKVYAKSNLERGEERRRCQTIPYHLRFPFYEPDFGWGKPPWVTSGTEFKNLILLMDTRDGDGIEVSLNLKEEDMAIFESTKELLEVLMCLHHSIHLNLLVSHMRFRGFELPQISRRSNFTLE